MDTPVETVVCTLRHAHTRFNLERRYAGTQDVPLSEQGRHDARLAARQLKASRFDVVVTSAQRRSLETARLIVGRRVPIVSTALCNERRFGVMEGRTWDEVQSFQPPVMFIRVGNELHSVNPQGGEPFEDLWQRAKRFRRLLFHEYRGKRILLISHGVFLQMFHGLVRGISCLESLASFPNNLELTEFRFRNRTLVGEEGRSLGGTEVLHW